MLPLQQMQGTVAALTSVEPSIMVSLIDNNMPCNPELRNAVLS